MLSERRRTLKLIVAYIKHIVVSHSALLLFVLSIESSMYSLFTKVLPETTTALSSLFVIIYAADLHNLNIHTHVLDGKVTYFTHKARLYQR